MNSKESRALVSHYCEQFARHVTVEPAPSYKEGDIVSLRPTESGVALTCPNIHSKNYVVASGDFGPTLNICKLANAHLSEVVRSSIINSPFPISGIIY